MVQQHLTQEECYQFAISGTCPHCGEQKVEGKYPGVVAGWVLYYCEAHKPSAWRTRVANIMNEIRPYLQYYSKWFIAGNNGTSIQFRKGNRQNGWDFKNIECNELEPFLNDGIKLNDFIESY